MKNRSLSNRSYWLNFAVAFSVSILPSIVAQKTQDRLILSTESCTELCTSSIGQAILGPSSDLISPCERVCEAVQEQSDEACVQALLSASPGRLTLMSYASAHVPETLAILLGVVMLDSAEDLDFLAGLHLYDRGSPEGCAALEDTHYCLGQGGALPLEVALCLPQSCDSAALTRFVGNITAGGIPPIGNSTTTSTGSASSSSGTGSAGAALVSFYCGDEGMLSVDAGNIAMFAVMATLGFLVFVGTALEYSRRRHDIYLEYLQTDDSGAERAKGSGLTIAATRAAALESSRAEPDSTRSGAWNDGIEEGKEEPILQWNPETEEEEEERAEEFARQRALTAGQEQRQEEFITYGNNDGALGEGTEYDPGREPLLGQRLDRSGRRIAIAKGQGSSSDDGVAWWWECLECFSLLKNVEKLLAPPRPGNEFPALDGVRTFSMLWVLLGHVILYALTGSGYTNVIDVIPVEGKGLLSRLSAQVIPGGFLSVDSFFLMSGFLLSSMLLLKLDSGKLTGYLWQLKVYLHRYLRLTPTVAFVTFFVWKVLPLLGQGATWWPLAATQEENCRKNWWIELVYLTNVLPWPFGDTGCNAVSWYLGNDMQFFFVGVPLVVLFHRRQRIGAAVVALIAAASCGFNLWLGFTEDLQYSIFTGASSEAWSKAYTAPWARCSVYAVGLLFGFLWHAKLRGRTFGSSAPEAGLERRRAAELDEDSSFSSRRYGRFIVPVIMFISAALLALPVYGTYWGYQDVTDPGIPLWLDHMYLAFSRPAWAVGLGLMCGLCFCGKGGLVNWFLTRPGWSVTSRLTFCAYLFHPLLLIVFYGSRSLPVRLTALELAVTYMGAALGTFAGATALHLLVEAPFRNLEAWAWRQASK